MKRLLKVGFASLCALSFLASSPKNVQTQSSIDSNIVEKKAPRIRIPNSKPIYLGDKLTLTTHRGNVIWYVFNPTETGVYVVDTYAVLERTQLCVESSGKRIFDCGGEKGTKNAKIIFNATKNRPVNIYVKLVYRYDLESKGTFELSLRKQIFHSFTFAPSGCDPDAEIYDINTTNDATVPINKMSNKCFTGNYVDCSYYDRDYSDSSTKKLLNKEYVLFSGHGAPDHVAFARGTQCNYYDSLDMSHTKVVFWSACQVAKKPNSDDKSFAEFAVERGAKCSIGFAKNIGIADAKAFTDKFFTKFAAGSTVRQAIDYALIIPTLYMDIGPLSVKVFGDDSITINDDTVSNGFFEIDGNLVNNSRDDISVISV